MQRDSMTTVQGMIITLCEYYRKKYYFFSKYDDEIINVYTYFVSRVECYSVNIIIYLYIRYLISLYITRMIYI